MAYDETLAERVRDALVMRSELTERKMFGGVAFMIAGNMAVGVINDELIVRLDSGDVEKAVSEPAVRPMDLTGRPMKGMVIVDSEALAADDDLVSWVGAGADFAAALPPKQKQ